MGDRKALILQPGLSSDVVTRIIVMLIILIVLSALSIVILIVGAGWLLISSGRTEYERGDEVGEELTAELMQNDDEEPILLETEFRGKSLSAGREASLSFREVKEQIRSHQWETALPLLLAIAGFFGLILFGSLALFIAMEDKLVGALIAAIAIFTLLRILIGMARA